MARHQTQTERDLDGISAKKKRETSPFGNQVSPPADDLAAPHEVEDRGTGVVEGPELEAIREDRPPLDRIRHLEKGLDAERKEKVELRERLEAVEKSREELLGKLVEMAERGFTAKLDVGKKTADENLAARRDWRGGFIKVLLIIAGAFAAFFAGRSAKP